MQTRFNMKTETLDTFAENFPGWAYSTWSDRGGVWHFEVTGPKGTWSGRGYFNQREAASVARMSIYRAQ